MNRVTLTGRLTKDPVTAERGGTRVCDLRIAENGRSGRCASSALINPPIEVPNANTWRGRDARTSCFTAASVAS